MNTQHYLSNLWRWKCGLVETEPHQRIKQSIEELKESQWSKRFEELCKNKMVLGTFRYGDYRLPAAKKYDRISSAIKRLENYKKTGNAEFLVDVANLCMIEFDNPNHKNAHFESIDDGEHVKQF